MTEQFCDENLLKLSEQQARELYAQGQEAVVWALLKLSALARQQAKPKPDPATPSAMIAPYQKPARKGRRKKPGRQKGHPGARRPAPPRIDIREELCSISAPQSAALAVGSLSPMSTPVRTVGLMPVLGPGWSCGFSKSAGNRGSGVSDPENSACSCRSTAGQSPRTLLYHPAGAGWSSLALL
jgi:hypothetical protein